MGICVSTYKEPILVEEKQLVKPTMTRTANLALLNPLKQTKNIVLSDQKNSSMKLINKPKISSNVSNFTHIINDQSIDQSKILEKSEFSSSNKKILNNPFVYKNSNNNKQEIDFVQKDEIIGEMKEVTTDMFVPQVQKKVMTSTMKIPIDKLKPQNIIPHNNYNIQELDERGSNKENFKISQENNDKSLDESLDHIDDKVNMKIDLMPEEIGINNLLQLKENSETTMINDDIYLNNYKVKRIVSQTEEKSKFEGIDLETYKPVKITQINKNYLKDKRNYIIPEVSSCISIEKNIRVYNTDTKITYIQSYRKINSLSEIYKYIYSEKQMLYVIFQIIYAISHLHKQGIYSNKITIDSFSVISSYKKQYFNIALNDYSFFTEENYSNQSDFFDISILFYYLTIKRMPHESTEQVFEELETKLSKFSLSLIAKLSSTNIEFELKKLIDHRSFNIYEINLSTISVLQNTSFIIEILNKLESNRNNEEITIKNSHNEIDEKRVIYNASARFLIDLLLTKDIPMGETSNTIENEIPIQTIVDRLEENLVSLVEIVNSNKFDKFEYDCYRVACYFKDEDNFSSIEDIKKAIISAVCL